MAFFTTDAVCTIPLLWDTFSVKLWGYQRSSAYVFIRWRSGCEAALWDECFLLGSLWGIMNCWMWFVRQLFVNSFIFAADILFMFILKQKVQLCKDQKPCWYDNYRGGNLHCVLLVLNVWWWDILGDREAPLAVRHPVLSIFAPDSFITSSRSRRCIPNSSNQGLFCGFCASEPH